MKHSSLALALIAAVLVASASASAPGSTNSTDGGGGGACKNTRGKVEGSTTFATQESCFEIKGAIELDYSLQLTIGFAFGIPCILIVCGVSIVSMIKRHNDRLAKLESQRQRVFEAKANRGLAGFRGDIGNDLTSSSDNSESSFKVVKEVEGSSGGDGGGTPSGSEVDVESGSAPAYSYSEES